MDRNARLNLEAALNLEAFDKLHEWVMALSSALFLFSASYVGWSIGEASVRGAPSLCSAFSATIVLVIETLIYRILRQRAKALNRRFKEIIDELDEAKEKE